MNNDTAQNNNCINIILFAARLTTLKLMNAQIKKKHF